MLKIVERMLQEAIKERIKEAFTWRNVRAVRDAFVEKVSDAVASTPNAYDDVLWGLCKRLLDDDNLAEVYSWIIANVPLLQGSEIPCKAVALDFTELRDKLELQECAGNYCAIPYTIVDGLLRVIIPLLIEWYNAK